MFNFQSTFNQSIFKPSNTWSRTLRHALKFLFFVLLLSAVIYLVFKNLIVFSRRIEIIKGIVDQPHLLNPLYAELNPVDKEISKLLFRGLISYNEKGEIVGDLAESWEVSEDDKIYTFNLKPNLTWHDGERFRADDVVFTIHLVQEADYQGPEKGSFNSITVEKVTEQKIKFSLDTPFAPFLDRLTLGILPKHKLFEISTKDLAKDEFNLNPIGTGNWQFADLKLNPATKKITSLTLLPTTRQPDNQPAESADQTTSFSFRFYESEKDLLTAFKLGEIHTFSTINLNLATQLKDWPNTKISAETQKDTSFVLFFNLKGREVLQNFDFRKALAHAIERTNLPGEIIDGPIPPSSWAYFPDINKYPFDQEKAKNLLSQFADEQRTLNLKFCEKSFCQELTEKIAKNWQEVGIKVALEELSKTELAETIENRNFEVLLLQQNLGSDPDQYALWHSSQIEPPGQNITGFNNRRVDKFLTDARKTLNRNERKSAYHKVQKEIVSELPAIFLIQPKLYQVSRKVRTDTLWSDTL